MIVALKNGVLERGKKLGPQEERKLLAALKESESQRRALIEGFRGILICFDQQMKARWLHRSGGASFRGGVGKKCYEIFCARSEACDSCALERCLTTGKIELSVQRINAEQPGEPDIVLDMVASPTKTREGDITGMVVLAQNVTDQFELEKRLRQSQKMEAVGTLAGGVAHDFNNILTPIMGYTEIIRLKLRQDGCTEGVVFDYLEEILKASRRAKSLVEQVLTFSRSAEKKAVLQYLHPIIKEVMKLMRVTLPSTIEITQDVDEKCGRALIDPVQMHQVLINLCNNASRAMKGEHGELTVRLRGVLDDREKKEMLELSIADTGCGIRAEHLERIFEPYFSTKEMTSGTGMGLAMVHGIVKRQGGYIKVESKLGEGTIFKIYLPVAKKETVVQRVVALGKLVTGSGKILLVDDEEQVAQVTGEILKSLGYKVIGMTSSEKAYNFFAENPDGVDLILTDLTMPKMTGLELCAEVKSIRPDIPVILFTGYSDQVSENRTESAGIDAYCMKPISMRDLSNVVGKFLGSGS